MAVSAVLWFRQNKLAMNTIRLEGQEPHGALCKEEDNARPSPVCILYGTHTGNSEQLAEETSERLAAAGFETKVYDMGDFDPRQLAHISRLLIIVSTDGDGEPPLMAEELLTYLYGREEAGLRHLSFSVLALGDTCYDQFCQAGKDFDAILERSGACRIAARIDCDVDYEENFAAWIGEVLQNLSSHSEQVGGRRLCGN